jgi:hypothetical protein
MSDGWAARDEQPFRPTSTHRGIQKQLALKGLMLSVQLQVIVTFKILILPYGIITVIKALNLMACAKYHSLLY